MPRNFIDEILDDVPKYTLRNSEGDVLNDNVDIALKTPVVQEGTPISKKFFDELFTYEELEYEKVDQSYFNDITKNLTFSISSLADNVQTVTGTATTGLYNGNPTVTLTPTMEMYTNASSGFKLATGSGSTTIVAVSAYINGNEKATVADINTVLSRTSYTSGYYLNLAGSVAKRFTFDLKAPQKATLKIRFASTYIGETATFSGSNDGSSFTTISSVAKDTAISIESTAEYRYYRVTFGGTAGGHEIYYMYLTLDDTRKILSFENTLTTQSELIANKEIIVKVPSTLNMSNVTSTTLNGFPVDKVLQAGKMYNLIFDGEKFVSPYTNPQNLITTGNFTSKNSDSQTINLSFTPDMVICYSADNNDYNIANFSGSTKANQSAVPRILTKAYNDTENGKIVTNGFSFKTNTHSVIIYYIAIKFWGGEIQ